MSAIEKRRLFMTALSKAALRDIKEEQQQKQAAKKQTFLEIFADNVLNELFS